MINKGPIQLTFNKQATKILSSKDMRGTFKSTSYVVKEILEKGEIPERNLYTW